MKKKYYAPEITVVKFNVEQMICDSIKTMSGAEGLNRGGDTGNNSIMEANSREVIQTQDAWKEW